MESGSKLLIKLFWQFIHYWGTKVLACSSTEECRLKPAFQRADINDVLLRLFSESEHDWRVFLTDCLKKCFMAGNLAKKLKVLVFYDYKLITG